MTQHYIIPCGRRMTQNLSRACKADIFAFYEVKAAIVQASQLDRQIFVKPIGYGRGRKRFPRDWWLLFLKKSP
jgi:hypothetical protein